MRFAHNLICAAGLLAACTQAPTAALEIEQAPVVPPIDAGMKLGLQQIFRVGQQSGNQPGVFSKIGDSLSDNEHYLKPLAQGDLEVPGDLAPVVDFYRRTTVRVVEGQPRNSFDLTSLGALSGWKTTDLLDPGSRFWEPLCGAEETPLACELRNTRPAVALILIGTNDIGVTPLEEYRANLSEIVAQCQIFGVIPVLSTLPPRVDEPALAEQVADYNQVVLAVAAQFDIPVWNYWQAMQSLPGQGLSADGLHPSAPEAAAAISLAEAAQEFGFSARTLTALQVLAKVKHVVIDDGPTD